jgi:hypothetical protein
MKQKVSFDFDGTLEFSNVQSYAKQLLNDGFEVWVVTTRYDENHKHLYPSNATLDDLWEVVDRLGIPRHHVRFTCMEWKCTYLDNTPFLWHLDDNIQELKEATKMGCSVPIVDVEANGWQDICNDIIAKSKKNEQEKS